METMELDALKNRLIKGIRTAHNRGEIIDFLHDTLQADEGRKGQGIPGVPSTVEEVRQDIAAFEAEMDAGMGGTTHAKMKERIKSRFPWLK